VDRRQLQQLHIPGISLAVVRDTQIIKAKGYGFANVEWNASATKDTVFGIGSMTKQFTATAIMMLVEQGKIGLDDKVTKYFPAAPATWNGITLRHLLSHTSGIQNWGELGIDETARDVRSSAQPTTFRA